MLVSLGYKGASHEADMSKEPWFRGDRKKFFPFSI